MTFIETKLDLTDVTHIDLVFENCEVYRIAKSHIHYLYFGDLYASSTYLSKDLNNDADVYISDYHARDFQLVLDHFGIIVMDSNDISDSFLIERIKSNDLVSVNLLNEMTGESQQIYLEWDGTDYENSNQKVFLYDNVLGVYVKPNMTQEYQDKFDNFVKDISDKHQL